MNSWYVNLIYLSAILFFSFVFLISLIVAIIFAVKKKSIKKPVSALTISTILFVFVILFICSHPTCYKYNDWVVLNSSIAQVEDIYGAFDVGNYEKGKEGEVGYYIYTDNGPFLPDHLKHYYYISYDKNGIIHKVYDACQKGG